MSRKIKILRTI
uniref:Uncharacterized protein n=1 Tax=Rhizophora mucronata TaxID=61149 RepID=A0A2P2QAN2_RHIMU